MEPIDFDEIEFKSYIYYMNTYTSYYEYIYHMYRINLYIIIRDSPRAKPIRLVRSSVVVISLINPKQPASKVAV